MSSAAEQLPFVDEHGLEIAAEPERVWESLSRVLDSSFGVGTSSRFARLLGCADTEPGGPRPLEAGSVLPGFHVADADRPRRLSLLGSHRFSRYALVFELDELAPGRVYLRAQTRAEFPGLHGSVYRTLVIGTRLHVLVTRRLLRAVRDRSERTSG